MDVLNKTIKKLTEEEYQELLMHVSGKKKNKPYMVLETSRTRNVSDSEMMEMLEVNPCAYYTLKSRLNDKIAQVLSQKQQSPINVLMEEVTKVPAHLYGTNREFSIRALTDLEKQLIEYDLSSELIVVYQTLAQLSLHTEHYDYYYNLYKKHVAFSLAVSKAEHLFHQFMLKMGNYKLTLEQPAFEELVMLKKELFNICEMYDSHRLFVIYNIVNIYYQCNVFGNREHLKSQEMEIEKTLQKIQGIFETYNQDTFYQNIKFIVDFLNFEYYQKTQNKERCDHYLEKINPIIPDLCTKHTMNFYIVQFLNSKIEKYLFDQSLDSLTKLNETLSSTLDIDANEVYHFVSFKKFMAISKFYQGDYASSAKVINDIRNQLSLKKYLFTDVECKLFQALQYCIIGEDSLCQQIIASVNRQVSENENEWECARIFIKILKTAMKAGDYRKKIQRIHDLWITYEETNNQSSAPLLKFVKLDDGLIRKMTNPIKNY